MADPDQPKILDINRLPPEIRSTIVGFVVQVYEHQAGLRHSSTRFAFSLAPFASVCREWQQVVEKTTFSEVHLSLDRMDDFERYVTGTRRRRLRSIRLQVKLPAYDSDPCTNRETWDDKMANNGIFTLTFKRLFGSLSHWSDDIVAPGGIKLEMCTSSPSDLRNAPFDVWQKRRWNANDIGEKRFAESVLDFVGNSEVERVVGIFDRVFAITSFKTSVIDRRAIMPAAYAEIVAALPRVKDVQLDIIKEKRLPLRKLAFTRTLHSSLHPSHSLDSLVALHIYIGREN
jgi:hypothetical protein